MTYLALLLALVTGFWMGISTKAYSERLRNRDQSIELERKNRVRLWGITVGSESFTVYARYSEFPTNMLYKAESICNLTELTWAKKIVRDLDGTVLDDLEGRHLSMTREEVEKWTNTKHLPLEDVLFKYRVARPQHVFQQAF